MRSRSLIAAVVLALVFSSCQTEVAVPDTSIENTQTDTSEAEEESTVSGEND